MTISAVAVPSPRLNEDKIYIENEQYSNQMFKEKTLDRKR